MSNARTGRAILFTLLAVCAAGGAMPSAQVTDPKTLGYPGVGELPVVKLLTPGSEPRTTLRYSVAKDYKMRAETSSETTTSMSMDGNAMPMELPAMKMGSDVTVTDVSATGDVTYNVAFTGITMVGGNPMLAQIMQGADADYKTVTGVVIVNSRGFNKSVKFDYSKISNPQLGQLMASSSGAMENICLPLPEEAIGAGARWEVRQSVAGGGFPVFQKTEYEVVSIIGKTVSLKVTQEGMALAQAVSNQLMPGAEAFLKSMTAKGSGTIMLQMDGLVPTVSLTTSSSTAMEVKAMGQTMNVTTETTAKVSVVAVAPPK